MSIEANYIDNYKLLISLMNNQERKVIAFLGAGLTRKFGFGTWEELIFGNNDGTSSIKFKSLKDFAELNIEDFNQYKNEFGEFDLLASAQKCFDKMGPDKWNEFLEKRFGDIDSITVDVDDDPIAALFGSKFFCFITTNFDAVLKRYGEKCINGLPIQVYPQNLHKPVSSNLIYLHGAGFKIFKDYSPQIVFTKGSYFEAYEKPSQIIGFLMDLIYYDMVFIGFSMNDEFISRFMVNLEELREKTIRNNPSVDPKVFRRNKFIILPNHSPTLRYMGSKNIEEISLISTEDNKLKSQALIPIRYKKESNDPHKVFPNLIKEILKEAPNKNLLSKPYDITEAYK